MQQWDSRHKEVIKKKSIRFYVAGPMRGMEDNNFPAFDDARDYLRSLGHEVISPACMDRNLGMNWEGPGDDKTLYLAYARDTAAVQVVDAMVVLPTFHRSKGVAFEVASANFLNIPTFLYYPFRDTMCLHPATIDIKMAITHVGMECLEVPRYPVKSVEVDETIEEWAKNFAKDWKDLIG